jgi:hypothetical protein
MSTPQAMPADIRDHPFPATFSKGSMRGSGPDIVWRKDPAGHLLSTTRG